jgi:tellurite resistance protein
MATSSLPSGDPSIFAISETEIKPAPSISWPAVFAGNAVTGGLILVFIPFGAALGLSLLSPYRNEGASGTTVAAVSIAWLAFMYLFSTAAGAYVAGRMRPNAMDSASLDESQFRDGVNGLVFWGVGMIVSALFTAMSLTSVLGTAATATGSAATQAMTGMQSANGQSGNASSMFSTDYVADLFLRTTNQQGTTASANSAPRSEVEVRGEIARILASSAYNGQVTEPDRQYLATLVASRTGLSETDARARVNDSISRMTQLRSDAEKTTRETAEAARKSTAQAAFWTAMLSLVAGFAAWYAAQIGGRHRDEERYF